MSKFARQAQTTEQSPDVPPSAPDERAADRAVAVMAEVLAFNGSSQAHEDLWSDTRQATDIVTHAAADLTGAEKKVGDAELSYRAERAKQLDRSAPRPRQWLLAAAALSLDGVACVFAAEALDGSQLETYGWAGLFLALLAAGELALDHYRDTHGALWRWMAGILWCVHRPAGHASFRVPDDGGLRGRSRGAGSATLFTVATAGFVVAGYRLLRAARPARRGGARCAVTASAPPPPRAAGSQPAPPGATGCPRVPSRIRSQLARGYSARELPLMEQALMAHLTGQEQAR